MTINHLKVIGFTFDFHHSFPQPKYSQLQTLKFNQSLNLISLFISIFHSFNHPLVVDFLRLPSINHSFDLLDACSCPWIAHQQTTKQSECFWKCSVLLIDRSMVAVGGGPAGRTTAAVADQSGRSSTEDRHWVMRSAIDWRPLRADQQRISIIDPSTVHRSTAASALVSVVSINTHHTQRHSSLSFSAGASIGADARTAGALTAPAADGAGRFGCIPVSLSVSALRVAVISTSLHSVLPPPLVLPALPPMPPAVQANHRRPFVAATRLRYALLVVVDCGLWVLLVCRWLWQVWRSNRTALALLCSCRSFGLCALPCTSCAALIDSHWWCDAIKVARSVAAAGAGCNTTRCLRRRCFAAATALHSQSLLVVDGDTVGVADQCRWLVELAAGPQAPLLPATNRCVCSSINRLMVFVVLLTIINWWYLMINQWDLWESDLFASNNAKVSTEP